MQCAQYKSFGDNTAANKKKATALTNVEVEMLKADIQDAAADAGRLEVEIAEHDDDISIWEGDERAATKVREIEKADALARPRASRIVLPAARRRSSLSGGTQDPQWRGCVIHVCSH